MFFSTFNPEAREAGFEPVDGFDHFFVNDGRSAERYNAQAMKLIKEGARVITAYERLAIGGLEGYVTMFRG
jgi:hypothetical protein